MASWLFTTTRYAASNALRMRRRREHHEHVAASRATQLEAPEPSPLTTAERTEFNELLDDAIASLGGADRACVVMSFLQQKSHQQLAEAMGISQEAARKRVVRAVERLRGYFATRGIAMTTPAIVAAPSGLVESTLNVAILSQASAAAGAGSAGAIAKAVTHMIFATKLKLAASIAAAVVLTGIVSAQTVQYVMQSSGREVRRPPSPAAVVDERFSATLGDAVVASRASRPFPRRPTSGARSTASRLQTRRTTRRHSTCAAGSGLRRARRDIRSPRASSARKTRACASASRIRKPCSSARRIGPRFETCSSCSPPIRVERSSIAK
jgi:hypothetical protein